LLTKPLTEQRRTTLLRSILYNFWQVNTHPTSICQA
jgi:hypothetical protein